MKYIIGAGLLLLVIAGAVVIWQVSSKTKNMEGLDKTKTVTPAKLENISSGEPTPSPATPTKIEPTIKESKTIMSENVTELKKEVLKEGTGSVAKAGDTVSVHYTGWLTDGAKFDSSVDRGTPFQFTLGAGMVIKGWDQGVAGMKVGEKVKLTIPASLGYGANGYPPVIPQNATLIFEVELLGIK